MRSGAPVAGEGDGEVPSFFGGVLGLLILAASLFTVGLPVLGAAYLEALRGGEPAPLPPPAAPGAVAPATSALPAAR